MKKAEVEIGGKYWARVSGKITVVKINCVGYRKGWNATNMSTGCEVHIKSAQRLRSPAGGKFVVTRHQMSMPVQWIGNLDTMTEPRWVEDKAEANRFPSIEDASAYCSQLSGSRTDHPRILEVAK